jgi:hypothetical protein
MAYKFIPNNRSPISYIGTGEKPNGDIGARLFDTADSSHWIYDGTTWQVYKDAALYITTP